MILKVFADESSTDKLATTPSLCGFIQSADYWPVFCRKWKRLLNNYKAPYFHYREFVDQKNKSVMEKSPYRTWSKRKKESFLYDLALLCSERAVPLVGSYDAEQHRKRALSGDIFEGTINAFFESITYVLKTHWPAYEGRVALVFDAGASREWTIALHKVHKEFADKDQRFTGNLAFSDDKEVMPLQAADLYANILRQHSERQLKRRRAGDDSKEPMRLLDVIFRKNMEPDGQFLNYSQWKIWKIEMLRILKHQKMMQSKWKREGNPRKYYPVEHFPELFVYPK